MVDYLQLMTSGKRVESRQQEVAEFSRRLKLLAKELEVPVIAISQLNRGPEQRTDKRPQLSDLRESGSLEQDADMVILVHRPDAYEPRQPPRRGGRPDHRQAPQRPDQDLHRRINSAHGVLPRPRTRLLTSSSTSCFLFDDDELSMMKNAVVSQTPCSPESVCLMRHTDIGV